MAAQDTPECSCGKRRFTRRRDAHREVTRLRNRFGRMQPYQCPTLPGVWHIGHRPAEVANGTITKQKWQDDIRSARRERGVR